MKIRWVCLVLASCAVVAGCGPARESKARRIDPKDVPFNLSDRGSRSNTARLRLYFVGEGHLVEVSRNVGSPVTVDAAFRVLLKGPTDDERARGLTTVLPRGWATGPVPVKGSTARVSLPEDFSKWPRSDQRLAVGQIVETLNSTGDVDGVHFSIAGRSAAVPRADGSLTEDPVGTGDVASLLSKNAAR